jgi:hypothetical protein
MEDRVTHMISNDLDLVCCCHRIRLHGNIDRLCGVELQRPGQSLSRRSFGHVCIIFTKSVLKTTKSMCFSRVSNPMALGHPRRIFEPPFSRIPRRSLQIHDISARNDGNKLTSFAIAQGDK